MSESTSTSEDTAPTEELVPDHVIPHKKLPPLKFRDLPEAISWKKMIGPSIMLAGLSLGSGEFILWPYITFKTGFIFFWACILGVITQYFLNMEISRWTLATGESAITGFCRLSKQWAWVFLLMNIIPWAWPGWATGAGTIISWAAYGPDAGGNLHAYLGIAGLFLVGAILTAGPVVYNTVEKIQIVLVGLVFIAAIILGVILIKPYAISAMLNGAVNLGGMPDDTSGLSTMALLGALAFAGAGGTMNLGQSNFIKDKGYGMGKYIGRITSPLTGQEEAISETGYFFKTNSNNLKRWANWWYSANVEHFLSFFFTCLATLVLLTLISYSMFYDETGNLKEGVDQFGEGLNFVWGQATMIESQLGSLVKYLFLFMGIAILLTTELGVLDATARISSDIVKVNYLRENDNWSVSKLYYLFLWGEILLGSGILLYGTMDPDFSKPLFLITVSAAMNGGVMFLYSMILLYLNSKILPRSISLNPLRFVAMVWSAAFFGYFSIMALKIQVLPYFQNLFE